MRSTLSPSSGVVDVGGWVAPAMELVYEQGTPEFRGQWPGIEAMLELAPLRAGDWDHPALELPADAPRRAPDDAWAAPSSARVATGVLHDNPAGRVAALDAAGVDLQLLSPGPSIDACLRLPSNLAAGVFAAYNRYVVDYCAGSSHRLGAVLQLHGSEPRWSAHELAELAGEPSVRAASLCLAVRISPDDRQFEPLWEALERSGLPLLHRPSFCARVWSPGRLLAYLRGAGVLERHPALRVAVLPGESERSAADLRHCIERVASRDDLGTRLFGVATAAQLQRGCDDGLGMLWASDFPLCGELRPALARTRELLGAAAGPVLEAQPRRFLGLRRPAGAP